MRGFGTISKDALIGKNTSDGELFKYFWEDRGFPAVRSENSNQLTPRLQDAMKNQTEEELKDIKGYVRRRLHKMATPQGRKDLVDSGEIQSATPIIFDPEIISVLKKRAPLLNEIPMEGQTGFTAKFDIITARTDPLGFMTEGDAADLSNNTPQDITFTTNSVDMTLWADLIEVSDFSQEAARHFMNVEDTVLGERLALFAQRKEQQILYGDNSQDTGTGFVGDANGYDGLDAIATGGSNSTDKSGTSSNFLKDIKTELAKFFQNETADPAETRIVVSPEFFDTLENEIGLDSMSVRPVDLTGQANIGLTGMRIKGVPVIQTHNVKALTDGAYTPGDPGDVFIFTTRAIRFRMLVPLSTIPLAKLGLAETSAIFEFGALIDKSDGNHVRHLRAYNF